MRVLTIVGCPTTICEKQQLCRGNWPSLLKLMNLSCTQVSMPMFQSMSDIFFAN